jgi:holo-[acyl-carrier protein] synthase
MIFGLGTDIVEIERIRQKLEKNPDLIKFIFSIEEIDYCSKQKKPEMHYAARFAVKEAFLKAFGVTFIGNHSLSEISVSRTEHGKPYITLNGRSLKTFQGAQLSQIHVSISHTDTFAVASVVIEKLD